MNKKTQPFLSIIIPVYNEEKRLNNLILITEYLKKIKYKYEIIVVNDGSEDKTKKLLDLHKRKHKLKILTLPLNKGKGAAIRFGMLSAKGKYRLFLDIDLSTPIEEFDKFLPQLKEYPIIIGSRKMKASNVLIRQPFIREILGKFFTYLSQNVLQMKVTDFTCGFKCFSQEAAEDIFSLQTIDRWSFDSEILYIGKIKKYKIKEIPISWADDARTKVKFPGDILNSLKELSRIRTNSIRGKYN